MIVPPSISNWDAAAPSASHLFLLVCAVVLIPLILGYNSLSYWTFRAKVRPRGELPVMAGQAVAPSLPAEKTGIWNDVASMSWSEFRPVEALACVPAIISLITFGLALGDMTAALAASSGALVVGFGAFQQDFRHPAEPMLLVSVGMSLSAGIGTLAHASLPLDLTCVALWGFGLGLMNIVGRGPGWLALQGSTALVIAAAFPATPVYVALHSGARGWCRATGYRAGHSPSLWEASYRRSAT